MSPHPHPYTSIEKFRKEFVSEINYSMKDSLALSQAVYSGSDGIKRRMASGLDLSSDDWEAIKALYDAEIAYADRTAYQLISTAEAESNRPLFIIVVGDHGDPFGERGLLGHNLVLHDGLIRVPALVIGMEGIVDGHATLTQHIDFTKTVGRLCGVNSKQFQGRDLRVSGRPYAISQRGTAHLDAYLRHNKDSEVSRFFEEPFTSVRTVNWKFPTNSERTMLSDLPNENDNVIEENPKVVTELMQRYHGEDVVWSQITGSHDVNFNRETKSHLRDIGYVS